MNTNPNVLKSKIQPSRLAPSGLILAKPETGMQGALAGSNDHLGSNGNFFQHFRP
jgi:hypothetical protein